MNKEQSAKRELLQRKQNYHINKHVFEAMANVVTFLEHCMEPTLQEVFKEDIEELLIDSNSNKELANSKKQPLLKTEYWNHPIITRLLNAIMTWNYNEDRHNFRLSILAIMQRIIAKYIMGVTQSVIGEGTLNSPSELLANDAFHSIVNNELKRLISFTEIIGSNAVKKDINKIGRPVLF
jgi:hypothetical protein